MIPFPKRWHHGHSLVAGCLVGLLLSYRPWLVYAAGVVTGVVVVCVAWGGYRLASELRSAWRSWHRSSSRKRPRPIRASSQLRDDEPLPF